MAFLSRRPAVGNAPGAFAIYVGFASLFLGSWWLFVSAVVVVLAALAARFLKMPSTAAAITMGVTLHVFEWSLQRLLGSGLAVPENLAFLVVADPLIVFVVVLSFLAFVSASWGWLRSLVGFAI